MKSRSHRLPNSDPHDDWVDGSWTVDCVCGVNFDDGEEMVNCDECGVWVHTRCSRYVKSEKLFACDKCKNKNARNDSEETEVAQLLVELPTQTLRMDNPYPPPHGPPRRPFRLWTDIPMEERVHVQGIPGGDPALFGDLSSVFSPELWKCTGYVPKKFNFQYREFPCWDEEREEVDAKMEEENENPVDKGAGVLFSLSKESVFANPVATLMGMKRQVQEDGHDKAAPSADINKPVGENLDVRPSQNGARKHRSLVRPFVVQSGKRRNEDLETSRDRTGKKKVRILNKEGDFNKKAHPLKTVVSTPSNDAKKMEFYEDRDLKVLRTDIDSVGKGSERVDNFGGGYRVVDSKPQNNLDSSKQTSETFSCDMSPHKFSVGGRGKGDEFGREMSSRIENSSKNDAGVLLLEENDSKGVHIKEEVVGVAPNKTDNGGCSSRSVGIDSHKWEPLIEDHVTAESKAAGENKKNQDSIGDMKPSSVQLSIHIKAELDVENCEEVLHVKSSPPTDVKVTSSAQHLGKSTNQFSSAHDERVISSQPTEHKVQAVERERATDKAANELPGPSKHKQILDEDLHGGSISVQKMSSELKHVSGSTEAPLKSGDSNFSSPAPPNQRKVVVSVGKSCLAPTAAISKPSISENCRLANVPTHYPAAKQLGISDSNFSSKKANPSINIVRAEDRHKHDMRKNSKEHPKPSVFKTSLLTNTSHASVSKKPSSDLKDPVLHSSSVASSAQHVTCTMGSGESANSSQCQSASHAQNKHAATALPQKGEKVTQSSGQPSCKVNSSPSMQPPATLNSNAALSDEELALLLHQELNSSPRVPRVPRMRHAGSLPQLASPTATTMLIKRTPTSVGKDNSSVSKRKNKDLVKDRSHSSRKNDDEVRKVDEVLDQRRLDSVSAGTDRSTKSKTEDGFAKGVRHGKKSTPASCAGAASSALSSSSEANEQNLSFACDSLQNASDDDTVTTRRQNHRTLPGLIAEIMSKGKRMTYEELCNAVLPHWPNLRKHNGERYAYSSHSQAVLDCLRNRHEWARLVDRGPKTSASRKRRKLEADGGHSFDSEEIEYRKGKEEVESGKRSLGSQREDFPKGKRKARKRRRLALDLQGRGGGRGSTSIKDDNVRRRKDDDEDDDSFSCSSEESLYSEDDDDDDDDEIQGSETCPVASEEEGSASSSSSSSSDGSMQHQ